MSIYPPFRKIKLKADNNGAILLAIRHRNSINNVCKKKLQYLK